MNTEVAGAIAPVLAGFGSSSETAVALGVVYAAAASYTDLTQRRIPNALTYSFFALGIALALAGGQLTFFFVVSVAAAFVFSYLAYKIGAWAGGDAKFFTVLVAFLGLATGPSPLLFASLFLNSVGVLVALIFLTRRGRFSLRSLRKTSDLKPGDIPAQSIFLQGRNAVLWNPFSPARFAVFLRHPDLRLFSAGRPAGKLIADSTRARGLSPAEISRLRRAGVKQLEVRESIAFAPALALGFVLSLYFRPV